MDNTTFEIILRPEEDFSIEYSKPLLVGPDGSAALITYGADNLSGARVRVEAHLSTPAGSALPPGDDGKWGTVWEYTYENGNLPKFSTNELVPSSWVRASVRYLAKDLEEAVNLKMALRTNPHHWASLGDHEGSFFTAVVKDPAQSFLTDAIAVGQDGKAALTTTDFHHINSFSLVFQKNLSFHPGGEPGDPNEPGWAPIPGMDEQEVTKERPAFFMAKDLIPGTRVRAALYNIQYASNAGEVRVSLRTHLGAR